MNPLTGNPIIVDTLIVIFTVAVVGVFSWFWLNIWKQRQHEAIRFQEVYEGKIRAHSCRRKFQLRAELKQKDAEIEMERERAGKYRVFAIEYMMSLRMDGKDSNAAKLKMKIEAINGTE